jgi:hypothetical protein
MRPFRPVQKGIGRLYSRSIEEELRYARTSVRRWWWEYLRLSKDYWLICQTSSNPMNPRTTDEGMRWLYRKFGDIYNVDFDTWYERTGSRIFGEQVELPKVIEIADDLSNLTEERDGKLLVEIPLSMTQASISRQINRILKQHSEIRPTNKLETSQSRFPINPVLYRLPALKKMHEIWCVHRELIQKPVALGTAKDKYSTKGDLFKIGVALRLSPSNEGMVQDVELHHKRLNRMRATVSRYLGKVQMLVGNVELGKYPVFKRTPAVDRFSKKQRESHVELEKLWWDLDLTSELSGTKVRDAIEIVNSNAISYNWYGQTA